MITNPEKMVFESTNDIVDYVSRGIIPTRKNFEKVMLAVSCPTPEDADPAEGEVRVPERLFINCDNNTMSAALNRVYKNRIRNRNITLGVIGVVAAGVLIGGIRSKSKKDDDIDDGNSLGMDIDFDSIEMPK